VSSALAGKLLGNFQESAAGVRKRGLLAMYKPELPLKVQLAHWNADQFSAADFVFHADGRHQGYAITHAHESLNGLQGGQFDVHVEGSFVLPEGFDNFVSIRRTHDVSDK
jgi:hypothetical protein